MYCSFQNHTVERFTCCGKPSIPYFLQYNLLFLKALYFWRHRILFFDISSWTNLRLLFKERIYLKAEVWKALWKSVSRLKDVPPNIWKENETFIFQGNRGFPLKGASIGEGMVAILGHTVFDSFSDLSDG